MGRALAWVGIGVVAVAVAWGASLVLGFHGRHEDPGTPTDRRVPRSVVAGRAAQQAAAARARGVPSDRRILFGDLHVHTTFSTDAFQASLPMLQGEGAHPVADACDFARFCSGLDFWSINDHAEGLTPRRWAETREAIRQCNAVAGNSEAPDVVAFLGWEWSQVGQTPADHYGHKNVVFRDEGDGEVPARPIAASGLAFTALRNVPLRARLGPALLDFSERQRYLDFDRFLRELAAVDECPPGVDVRELPTECLEAAATPAELFEKLSQWGFDVLVIPHGNSWGMYTPPGSTWDKQLAGAMHDPDKQSLIEVHSGHGNSEEYRSWRAVNLDENGVPSCPEPTPDYLPSCWRAGEIIETRCREAGLPGSECQERAERARQHYAEAWVAGWLTVPGARAEDWQDAGQCRDCFLPAFNYRPGGSVQYSLSISNFDGPDAPRRFRFGFLGSSDNHTARPGTGYKEFWRGAMSDGRGPRDPTWRRRIHPDTGEPAPESIPFDLGATRLRGFQLVERERRASFLTTGGLVAVHAEGRDRSRIWDALRRREVYATSGDRILLWFDLLNGPRGERPMGSEVTLTTNPRFRVRAVGAFEQQPGCPDPSLDSLGPDRLERLCRGECYNPSDRRKRVARIEVVRIRPQAAPDESVSALIQDPWIVHACAADGSGCDATFEDPDFAGSDRDAVYYVRAIQEPSLAVNGGGFRCEYDETGRCIRMDPCWGDDRTDPDDDCLSPVEERAWSSPIFVDHGGTRR